MQLIPHGSPSLDQPSDCVATKRGRTTDSCRLGGSHTEPNAMSASCRVYVGIMSGSCRHHVECPHVLNWCMQSCSLCPCAHWAFTRIVSAWWRRRGCKGEARAKVSDLRLPLVCESRSRSARTVQGFRRRHYDGCCGVASLFGLHAGTAGQGAGASRRDRAKPRAQTPFIRGSCSETPIRILLSHPPQLPPACLPPRWPSHSSGYAGGEFPPPGPTGGGPHSPDIGSS